MGVHIFDLEIFHDPEAEWEEETKKREHAIKNQIVQAVIKDETFRASLENEWVRFQQLYTQNEFLHEYRFNRFEDTALHIAISSYHPDRDDSLQDRHLNCIKEMVVNIPQENRLSILKQKNKEGNTPLHLAAELGIVRIIEFLVNPEDATLIWETNSKGETPLFITAYRGKLQAFLYLQKCVQHEKEEGPIELCGREDGDPIKLCRREDGDNILHAAISREYFELAFQIIHYYPPLVNRYNTKGMSPLHVLSRMPQVFRRGRFRFRDSIIHLCMDIDELELMTYKPGDSKPKFPWNPPENYQTLVEFLELLWNGTWKILDYIKKKYFGNRKDKSEDTTPATNVNPEESSDHQNYHQNDLENPPIKDTTNVNQDKMSQDHQIDCQYDPENPPIKDTTNVNQDEMSQDHQSDCQYDPEDPPIKDTTNVNQDEMSQGHQIDRQFDTKNPSIKAEGKRNDKWFPANYTIFIKFLKCLMRIVLIVLAIGLPWIKMIEERKRQYARGVQIMKLLIEKDERYKFYESTGEEPKYGDHCLLPPTKPPLIVEDDDDDEGRRYRRSQNITPPTKPPNKTAATEQSSTSSTDEKKKDDHKSELPKPTKETPLLVASRMGIVEMVKKILKKFPIAIQDLDSDEKNILLLAVEHRQPDLYNWLMREKYPPYVYYQVDKDGNNAVHLAAKYQKLQVWRTPGSALQLQDERKWYHYVKQTLPPQSYVPYNNKGQAPKEIFRETHENLRKEASEWLLKTANSCSVVAALIATVAFTTAATIPGGPGNNGHPQLENQPAFNVFSLSSLFSLCFSVTALVYFLAILTSRCQYDDFEKNLPRKLRIGLTSLFTSIAGILVSFCAAHFFVLEDKFKKVAFLIYGVTCIPVVLFAINQFPLYFDLISSSQKLPDRFYKGYKEFYTDSSLASSSDQKKADKDD